MNKMQKLSILSLSFISLIATAAMAPALNGIQSHFINAPETLIKLVVTLPALICIPIGLLNKAFMKFISKKNLIIIGLLLYTIGGLSSSLSPNIYVLLFTKVILGLGLGITAPLSLVLIGDFFHGKERAKFMGFATATTNLGGIISTLFVGFLVSLGWRYSFLVYAVAIIVLFLIVFFLPNDYENNEEKLSTGNIEEDIKLNKGIFKYAILVFLGLIAFYAIPTNMDFLVKLRNLGGASTAANIVSIGTLTSLISAMIFPKLIKIFKRYFSLIIFISMFLGFIILGTAHSMPMILIGAIFVGFGFGDVIPFGMLFASNLVHKTHTALAILIVTTGLYFGEFVSPLILQFLSKTLNIQNVTGSLFGACIVCIVVLLVSIYAIISDRKLVI
ncbi:MFS transporter [uncultured Clostridium sp.]|uniref:MFS transporter n=1 Tax=uncultured Clostridium sp. TaxID=59620 RepID=UPI00258A445A|nr:MFS transporter [uncultured Clostridium sp.]